MIGTLYITDFVSTNITLNSWLADSATSSHICNQKKAFTSFTPIQKYIIGIGDTEVKCEGKGTVYIKSQKANVTMCLENILYVPTAPNNLFSLSRLDDAGRHTKFGNGAAELFDKHNNLLAKRIKVQRMYLLDAIFDTTSEKVNISTT